MNNSNTSAALVTFEIATVTGKDSGSQADDKQVHMTLQTNTSQSSKVLLKDHTDGGHDNDLFQQGDFNKFRTDDFNLPLDNSSLVSTTMYVENKDDWNCQHIFVTNTSNGQFYHTTESHWISNGSTSFPLSQYLERVNDKTEQHCSEFLITVATSADKNAETNDHVFVQLIDSHGNASEFILMNNFLGEFSRGDTESFRVDTPHDLIGPITRVILQKEEGNGWKPSTLTIERQGVSDGLVKSTFSFTEWLDGEDRWVLKECNEDYI
ncbi:PLAT/LH2 domain-containing protein [Photorhabdus aegyptia]|uniref:PLAT/LH2 domain-containing protein n=1 Tax=Photorhabdus aegyptia TaxID=2805098 RepID=UPI001E3E04EF|nr:PLAT/LH2 domain-containing protein [Photorhabdus aegyptia]MCC8459113.1 hypothetical protein [Photorhabdus aegyptia]